MDHNQKLRKFIEGEQGATTDSGEDLDNDLEDDAQTRSSSPVKSAGDLNSISSISTSILENEEEIKTLKDKLFKSEEKCANLERDINQIILT